MAAEIDDVGGKWELINDITVEEDVSSIDTGFWNNRYKKLRIVLDTLSAEADTNYMSINIFSHNTTYANLLRFYAVAMPRKQAERSYYEIENCGDGNAIIGIYHSTTQDGFDVSGTARVNGVSGGKMMLKGADSYGGIINESFTGLKINTYGTFVVGTRLRIWGVRA